MTEISKKCFLIIDVGSLTKRQGSLDLSTLKILWQQEFMVYVPKALKLNLLFYFTKQSFSVIHGPWAYPGQMF